MAIITIKAVLDLARSLEWQLTILKSEASQLTWPNLLGYERKTGILRIGIEPDIRKCNQLLLRLSDLTFFNGEDYRVDNEITDDIETIKNGKAFFFWEETIPGEIIYQWLLNLLVLDNL